MSSRRNTAAVYVCMLQRKLACVLRQHAGYLLVGQLLFNLLFLAFVLTLAA